jgi:hypothetical protein
MLLLLSLVQYVTAQWPLDETGRGYPIRTDESGVAQASAILSALP